MVMSLRTWAVRMALTTAFIEREYPVTPAKKEAGKPRQDMIASWPLKWGFRLSAEKISASTTCKQQTGRFKLMWRITTVSLPSAQDLYQVSREHRLAQRPLTPPSCAVWSAFLGNWKTELSTQWTALIEQQGPIAKLPWDYHDARWFFLGSWQWRWPCDPAAAPGWPVAVQSVL